MAWSALANNQFVSRSDLQDAVTTGVFTLKSGQSIPGTEPNRWITRSEVETWINATVTNGASNQFPQKSWIVANISTTTTTTTTIAGMLPVQGILVASNSSGVCDFQNFPTTLYIKTTISPRQLFLDNIGTVHAEDTYFLNMPSENVVRRSVYSLTEDNQSPYVFGYPDTTYVRTNRTRSITNDAVQQMALRYFRVIPGQTYTAIYIMNNITNATRNVWSPRIQALNQFTNLVTSPPTWTGTGTFTINFTVPSNCELVDPFIDMNAGIGSGDSIFTFDNKMELV